MRALHLFFQLHQPYTLKAPEGEHEYFAGEADFREADRKCYQPFFALLERNTQRHVGLKISLLVSGVWLEQAERWDPELVRRLQKLVDLKQVELVATPYYASLAAFFDKDEFLGQVEESRKKIEGKFSTACQVLAAPGLMYHDRLARWAKQVGFQGALAGDGLGVLGFRSPNRVYDAAGVGDFRVLFENGRLSQALREGEDLVLVESEKPVEDFTEVEKDGEGVDFEDVARRSVGRNVRRATAAEFVRGMAGARMPMAEERREDKTRAVKRRVSGKMVYSAKKFQKALDLECLRGNLVSLCLDAEMFGAHRDDGVVAFFDELFASWLKVPGNKFVTASEAMELLPAVAEISVKVSVGQVVKKRFANAEADEAHGLARPEDVQYTLPNGYRSERQIASEDRLYRLRERILKSKNEDLLVNFRRLSAFDYVLGRDLEIFERVLRDFEGWVDEIAPKPKKLRAENADSGVEEDEVEANLTASRQAVRDDASENEVSEEDDYTVKVHRILKKASQPTQVKEWELGEGVDEESGLEAGSVGADDEGDFAQVDDFGEYGGYALSEEDLSWARGGVPEDDGQRESVSSSEELDDSGGMEGDLDGLEEESLDEFDLAEAEVQVIAQRMKRARGMVERELEALAEAEVVSEYVMSEEPVLRKTRAKFGASREMKVDVRDTDEKRGDDTSARAGEKKKARRRIVLD